MPYSFGTPPDFHVDPEGFPRLCKSLGKLERNDLRLVCPKKRCPKRGYCVSEYQPGLEDWTDLFIRWSAKNQVVVLVPTATDTEWFAKAFRAAKDVTFLAARVQFVNPETGQPDPGNTTGSVIFRFNAGSGCGSCPHVTLWDWRKDVAL